MKWIRKKIPYIEQMSQSECGLACVAMMLRYYNSYDTLQDLREYLDTGRDGASIKQLMELLEKKDFTCKAFEVETNQLNQVKLPAIIYYGNKHYVILEEISKKYVRIVDPNRGSLKVSLEEFEKTFLKF